MTLNDLEWLFHDKMRFWPALLESERLNVRNGTTSAIPRCSVHFTIYMYLYLYSYRRETARQLRIHAQLTRCFSAVAELLVKKPKPFSSPDTRTHHFNSCSLHKRGLASCPPSPVQSPPILILSILAGQAKTLCTHNDTLGSNHHTYN